MGVSSSREGIIIKTKITITVAIALIIGIACFYGYSYSLKNKPVTTAERFITYLAKQNWDEVKKMASGKTLYTIKTRHEQARSLKPAEILNLDVDVQAVSKTWACINVCAETRLVSGTTDVLWYRLFMQKKDNWKVYRAVMTAPDTSGTGSFNPLQESSIKSIRKTFINYLTLLSENKHQEANSCLVGLSRLKMQTSQLTLNSVIKDFKDVKVEPVWHKGKTVVARINYTVNDRKAETIVTAYKTTGGWKIAEISTG